MMTWWQKPKSTPSRRQIDPIECGAVCLGIILEHLGRFVDTKTLREETGVSRDGADAQSIIVGAQKFGLTGSARKLLVSEFDQVQAPAILFFDNCHFVVYEGRRLNYFYINDPARGHYALDVTRFRRRYSRVVLQFQKNEGFTHDIATVEHALTHASSGERGLAIIFGALLALTLFSLARIAGLFQTLSTELRLDYFAAFVLLVACSMGCLLLLFYGAQQQLYRRANIVVKHETDDLLRALLRIAPSFFDERPWVIFERSIMSSCERAHAHVHAQLAKPFWGAFLTVALAGFILITPHFGLAIAVSVTALFVIKSLRTRGHAIQQLSVTPVAPMLETVSTIEALKAMGHTDLLVEGFMQATMPSTEPHRFGSRSAIWCMLVVMAAILLVNTFALPLWRSFAFPVSRFAELIILGAGIIFGALKLFFRPHLIHDETASLRREMQTAIRAVPDSPEDPTDVIVLHDVSFTYPGEHDEVLHRVSLSVKRGDIIGVVGAAGAGISTLFKIIGRLIEPKHGVVQVAGFDGKQPRIVLINDESDIPDGTLRDVITLRDEQVSDDAVVDALKHAMATELFYRRPMGLLAPIEPHGHNLSASEKYRLLLAQALAHKPDVLVLDDFFLSVDATVAADILAQLRNLAITAIFNSYDGALLAITTRTIFMQQRTIHKIDRHEHLYFGDDLYRELVKPSVIEDDFV